MIETVYAQASFSALVLCGVITAVKRDRYHGFIFLALASYWIILGVMQVQLGLNSIPFVSIPLNGAVAYVAIYTAEKTRTLWPILIAIIMALSIGVNVAYAAYEMTTDNPTFTFRRLHQDAGAVMFYMSLICLSVHPKARARNEMDRTLSYC